MSAPPLRFPAPLRPGDRIGVTAPSAGVEDRLRGRLDHAVGWLRGRGFEVAVGECMDGAGTTSAPREQRAAELVGMLTDPAIRAVVPPWGGETAIDLLDVLDWEALGWAEPTWVVGFSDTDTWMLPLTLRLGWGTMRAANLMDTPYAAAPGHLHWTDAAAATGPVTQRACGRFARGWDDWERDPTPERWTAEGRGTWSALEGTAEGPVDVAGRLVGGCIETLGLVAATRYGDVAGFGRAHADEGLVVFVEAAEWAAPDICRALHALRLAGWFDHASAVLVGRTHAPDSPTMTQREAVADALGGLGVPVVLDVECGHVPPYLSLVNGARTRVLLDAAAEVRQITQEWA